MSGALTTNSHSNELKCTLVERILEKTAQNGFISMSRATERSAHRRRQGAIEVGFYGVFPTHGDGHLHPLASRALGKMSRPAASRLLETPGYGKRCSIGCVSACSTLIPALSSLKPSTYTHQLRVGDAASRAEAVMSDGTR